MSTLPTDPKVAVWVALIRANARVISRVQAGGKAAGLPPLEWYDVLWELERSPDGVRPFELEGRLLLAQYNLSRLVGRLEGAGYVSRHRCENDGRGQVLKITEEGKALRKRMWPVYSAEIERHIGAHLSDEQAGALSSLLLRLIEAGQAKAGSNRESCG